MMRILRRPFHVDAVVYVNEEPLDPLAVVVGSNKPRGIHGSPSGSILGVAFAYAPRLKLPAAVYVRVCGLVAPWRPVHDRNVVYEDSFRASEGAEREKAKRGTYAGRHWRLLDRATRRTETSRHSAVSD